MPLNSFVFVLVANVHPAVTLQFTRPFPYPWDAGFARLCAADCA